MYRVRGRAERETHLTQRHDDGKHNRAEHVDCVIDKQLTHCRTNGEHNHVEDKLWML